MVDFRIIYFLIMSYSLQSRNRESSYFNFEGRIEADASLFVLWGYCKTGAGKNQEGFNLVIENLIFSRETRKDERIQDLQVSIS